MKAGRANDMILPKLRDDLRIYSGPSFGNGAPSWIIYDPLRHRFFRIGQHTLELYSLWTLRTLRRVKETAKERFGRVVSDQDVRALIGFMLENELTERQSGDQITALSRRYDQVQTSLMSWLTGRFLFFRVPILRPDSFLRATLPWVRPLFSRTFLLLVAVAGAMGVWLVSRQLEVFLATVDRVGAFDLVILIGATLFVTKSLHELGHAYQATMRGCRVSSMGVAFMVMFPLLYTDVSDAWRLRSRRDRLMIDAGGILVELSLAALATFAWVFLPDGPLRLAAFVVATSGWIMSLFVNLNPFMRFDGYYILSDYCGVQNLQPRSFAICRWWLRETLFGLDEQPPEQISRSLRRGMIIYALATWMYRLALFIGISLLVYHFFFKALGALIFLITVHRFLLMPVLKEVAIWWRRRAEILRSRRAWGSGLIFGLILVLLAYPWPVTVFAPAVLSVGIQKDIYAADVGRLVSVDVEVGQNVAEGEILFRLENPDLRQEERAALEKLNLTEVRLDRRTSDERDRAATLVLQREQDLLQDRLQGLSESKQVLNVRAATSGIVAEMDTALRPGLWLSGHNRLGVLIAPGQNELKGYLSETDLDRLNLGDVGWFVPDDPTLPKVEVVLESLSEAGVEELEVPELSSINGGQIAIVGLAEEGLVPAGSWFAFKASAVDTLPGAKPMQRGVIRFQGRAESPARRIFEQIARVFIREASL